MLCQFQGYSKVIHTHTHTHIYIFQILFLYKLLHDIEYSSLGYTAGPYCLSVLYTEVCICPSQAPSISLFSPVPFGSCKLAFLWQWVCELERGSHFSEGNRHAFRNFCTDRDLEGPVASAPGVLGSMVVFWEWLADTGLSGELLLTVSREGIGRLWL